MSKKWEYATIPLLIHNTKGILDTWGEDGWELVQVIPGPTNPENLVAYLKREKEKTHPGSKPSGKSQATLTGPPGLDGPVRR